MSGKPQLSVVIPTLGRDILIRTLDSLIASQGFSKLEIIVAGRVPHKQVAADLQARSARHANLKHLDIRFDQGDSSRKKNAGAAMAQAPLIAFLDDDVVVAPDWPQQMMKPFLDARVGLASGPSLVPEDINRIGRLAGLALSSWAAGYVAERYQKNREAVYPVNWERVIGCNAAYRREAFAQMGGFPVDFYPGEEMIAAYRTEQAGWKLVFVPTAWVQHYPRQSLLRFWRQIWGYGATRIRLLRGGVTFNLLPLVPGGWVAMTLGLGLLAPFWAWANRLLWAELGMYFMLALVVTLRTIMQTRRWRDGALLAVIPFMHLAYGLAGWVEVFRPGRDFTEKMADHHPAGNG